MLPSETTVRDLERTLVDRLRFLVRRPGHVVEVLMAARAGTAASAAFLVCQLLLTVLCRGGTIAVKTERGNFKISLDKLRKGVVELHHEAEENETDH
jgi:hypothetical protein